MITLIGIGHVFSIKKAVRYLIKRERPQAVCVELDKVRFDILENGLRDEQEGPFLMKRLKKVYDKAANMQGASVGEEMMGAVEAAKELDIPHYFIDVEASPVVSNMLKGLSLGQKLKLAGSVLTTSVLPKKQLEQGLKKVEEDPEFAMKQFEKAFPTLKRDLVDYRDNYMATRIKKLHERYQDIIAVVGEGHMPGIIGHLEGFSVKEIHLKDVRKIAEALEKGDIKENEVSGVLTEDSNSHVEFGFNVEIRA